MPLNENPLSLEATVKPNRLSADALVSLSVTMVLKNETNNPLPLFPDLARLHVESGWPGPHWKIEVTQNGTMVPLYQLRRNYGPPGMPPDASFFDKSTIKIKPGKTHQSTLDACWIPSNMLSPAHLDPALLDPQKMDGFLLTTDKPQSALVLGRTCKSIQRELKARVDFLRPGIFALLDPAAPVDMSISYAQQPTQHTESTQSSPAHLRLDL